MATTNHAEIIAGRLKHLLAGIRAAEAQAFDWPRSLESSFMKWSEQTVTAARIVGGEIQKAAENFQK